EILDRYSLLLHPGEIAEVEDAFAIEMAELEDMVVHNAFQMTAEYLSRVHFVESVRIVLGKEVLPLADVERGAVGGHRHDHLVAAEIKMPGDLDGGDDVGQSRDADIVKGPDRISVDLSPSCQISPPDISPEQHIERISCQIRYAYDNVRVHHVVNERNVLVANALDVVLAVSIAQHGGALERLDSNDLAAVAQFQIIAGGDGSGRSGRLYESRQARSRVRFFQVRKHAIQCGAGGAIVDQIVRKLGELIDDDVTAIAGELGALVVNFLDVAFGSRRADDVGGITDPLRQPFEALAAHPGGQYRNPAAADNARYGNAS